MISKAWCCSHYSVKSYYNFLFIREPLQNDHFSLSHVTKVKGNWICLFFFFIFVKCVLISEISGFVWRVFFSTIVIFLIWARSLPSKRSGKNKNVTVAPRWVLHVLTHICMHCWMFLNATAKAIDRYKVLYLGTSGALQMSLV